MTGIPVTSSQELEPIPPAAFLWRAYDPKVKADLFSTGLETPAGTYLVDPIPLAPAPLSELRQSGSVVGIFVTNENHIRAAGTFAETFGVPIYLHPKLSSHLDVPGVTTFADAAIFSGGLTALAIDGAPLGESALYSTANGGTLVVGDALINFEPYGFDLLPDKYCLDPALMRRCLPRLLDYTFERIFFAHGTPIVHDAYARLEQLLRKTR